MSHTVPRRSLMSAGATGLVATLLAPDRASGAEVDAPHGRVRWASEFGVRADGRTDDTDALTAGLQWAASSRAVLLLDPGFVAVRSIEIPSQATLRGVAGGASRFGQDGRQVPAALVPHPDGDTSLPLVVITGTGARLEGIGLAGGSGEDPAAWSRRPGLVVRGGVEVVLQGVRVFRFVATGIRIEQLNNARWSDVFVDDCGTTEQPAVRIESVGCTNYVHFDGLTIERSANTALDIATGTDPVRDWAADLLFTGLHIESNADGASPHALNTSPLVDVGNVRALTFVAPQLLGRPAALIRYRQQIPSTLELSSLPGGDARDQQGGVQILGGHLKQHGGGDGAASRVATVELSGNGRGFVASSVKFDALWCPGVLVRDGYGHDVVVQGCTFRRAGVEAGWPASVLDERNDAVRRTNATVLHGVHRVIGGLLVAEGVALVAATTTSTTSITTAPSVRGGWVSPSQGAGTDHAGRAWCRPEADVEGPLFTVGFASPHVEQPIVQLTPRTLAAARALAFAELELDDDGHARGFIVHAAASVPESSGLLLFDYVVVGRVR